MLWLLVAGVLLWSLVHLFPCVMPIKRAQVMRSLGSKYQGLFALAILFSIVLMVLGWRNTEPTVVYAPPAWGRHLTMLLMVLAIILFGAASMKTRVKRYIRHPMLAGMLVWGIAHLLANGDIRSVTLFAGLAIWSVVSMYFINRRDDGWIKPLISNYWQDEVKLVAGSVVIYLVLVFLHPYFTGVSLLPSP